MDRSPYVRHVEGLLEEVERCSIRSQAALKKSKERLDGLPPLPILLTMEAALELELEPSRRASIAAQEHRQRFVDSGISARRAWAWIQQRRSARRLRKTTALAMTGENVNQRENRAREHNLRLQSAEDARAAMKTEYATWEADVRFLSDLKEGILRLRDRLHDKQSWVRPSAFALIRDLAASLHQSDWNKARKQWPTFSSGVFLADEQQRTWLGQAKEILRTAQVQGDGFVATASLSSIIEHSVASARPAFLKEPLLREQTDAVRAWANLVAAAADPRTYVHKAQWMLYWAAFQGAQAFAAECNGHTVEDSLTGSFLTYMRIQWMQWAAHRMDELGYPATSFVTMLKVAGKSGETETGADIGLIVDIDIGDLVVRKVVWLQAKNSVNGVVDIGGGPTGKPPTTQLQKLSTTPWAHYLFYHQRYKDSPAPFPTVELVERTVQRHNLQKRFCDPYLPIATRESGYDWATFFAFGLCSATSSVGEPFARDESPLDTLTRGSGGRLPKYLDVISLSADERRREYEQELERYYIVSLNHRIDRDPPTSSKGRSRGLTR